MYQINEYVWAPKDQAANIVAAVLQPSIRYTREECIDLPPTMIETLEVDFTPEQSATYDKMAKELYLQVEAGQITAVNAAVALNKLLQISAGAVKTNDGEIHQIDCSTRLNVLYEIFEQTPQRQLVVFATFVASVKRLVEFFKSKNVSVAAIYGEVDQNTRGTLIDQFQNGQLNVLILQPQSSAHGITLTSASTIVWYSLIPSNELYQQGNARIIRPGQTRKTMIIRFVSSKAEKHI
jgi:SNF2 family DNA or RNA helicase